MGAVLFVGLVASSSAWAKIQKDSFEYFFPGIDIDGNIDDGLGDDGTVRVRYNTRRDRLTVVGRAVVGNDSKKLQVFNDAGVIDNFIVDGDVVTDRYRVAKNGRATYNGLVKNTSGLD
ncbi:hypothetical protein AYO47_00045 [Planctomyces sp. SCGC AG-212-M04]|nr:hypothetical protein AYO47_00045 [Planctomyces sp. SCGC AG-212-M04]